MAWVAPCWKTTGSRGGIAHFLGIWSGEGFVAVFGAAGGGAGSIVNRRPSTLRQYFFTFSDLLRRLANLSSFIVSHSHTMITFHPALMSAVWFLASRAVFSENFLSQKSVRVFGVEASVQLA
jgi:hypothetical protein